MACNTSARAQRVTGTKKCNTRRWLRVAALSLAVVVLLGVVKPPRAQAVGIGAIAPVIASFLAACGLEWTVQNANSGLFQDAINELLGEYLSDEQISSVGVWIGDSLEGITAEAGKLILPRGLVGKLITFTTWLIAKKAITAGSVTVLQSNQKIVLPDGSEYMLSSLNTSSTEVVRECASYSIGTRIPHGTSPSDYITIDFGHGFIWHFYESEDSYFYRRSSETRWSRLSFPGYRDFCFALSSIGNLSFSGIRISDGLMCQNGTVSYLPKQYLNLEGTSISIAPERAVSLPEEGQGLAISTGLPANTTDDLLQAILSAIIAGNLVATPEVTTPGENEGTETGFWATLWGWLTNIWEAIKAIPGQFAGWLSDILATIKAIPGQLTTWLSDIWESIKALPLQIIHGLRDLVIPKEAFFATAIANLKGSFDGRMGLLTYPLSLLFTFVTRVAELSGQEPILRWGSISIFGTELVKAGQYNLNDSLKTVSFKTMHDIYLIVADAFMVGAFIELCRRKLKTVIFH